MRWLILALLPLPALAFAQQFPPVDWMTTDPARVELGQLLFYDPILSGNREVSCATCHNPAQGTSDGLSLGLGDGGIGLGPERRADPANLPEQRLPRNAPALFNLGAAEFSVMFHDGRLEADPTRPGGIRTPLGEDMVAGFTSVLAAQAMFPVLSGDEMAGHYSENEIAQAVRMGFLSQPGGAWERIAARVAAIPEYRARFDAVLGQGAEIRFTDIGNVIAEFIAHEWRADDSPFDRYLEGEPLPAAAERGRALFYGDAGCSSCHAGRFHPADAYAFRTPSLRNVTQTAPYGHAGAYATLEGVIRHHLDPVAALMGYDRSQAVLPALDVADWPVLEDEAEMAAIAAANELAPMVLSDPEIADLIAFLDALTDPREDRLGVPDAVPSGLPVAR